ncbi:MAG: hypothetical protein ABL998_03590 [Planctomycetota bacterium]
MKEVQAKLFSGLASVLPNDLVSERSVDLLAARYVNKKGADDESALKYAKIEGRLRVPGFGVVAMCSWKTDRLLAIPVALVGDVDVGLVVVDNAGLVSLFCAESCVDVVASPLDLYDKVFYRAGSYELEEVSWAYAPFLILRLDERCSGVPFPEAWSQALSQVSVLVSKRNGEVWKGKALEAFEALNAGPASRYMGHCLIEASISSSQNHAFLEIYRCLEALYEVHSVERLLGTVAGGEGVSRGAVIVNALKGIDWKLRQDSALRRILSCLGEADIDEVSVCLGCDREKDGLVKVIYDLRNSIAHGRLGAVARTIGDSELRAICLVSARAFEHTRVADSWLAS